MAYATGYSNIQGILAPGQFHPTKTKETSQASNISLLGHQKKKITGTSVKDRVGKYTPYFKGTEIHSGTSCRNRTKDPVLHNRHKNKISWNKKENLRGAIKIRKHPMPVFLPAKFRYSGCPDVLGGASCEAGWG